MRLLVTGSRDWPLAKAGVISRFMDRYDDGEMTLLHGCCPYGEASESPYKGVDGHAEAHALRKGWEVLRFPPEPSNGRYPVARDFAIRNQKMVDEEPDIVLAFYLKGAANKGTQMTEEMALNKNLYVVRIIG